MAISPRPGARRNWKGHAGRALKYSRWRRRGRGSRRGRNPRHPRTRPSGPFRPPLAGLRFGTSRSPDCDIANCRARAGDIEHGCPRGPFHGRCFVRRCGCRRQTTCWQHKYPDFRHCRNRTTMHSFPHRAPPRPLRLRPRKRCHRLGCGRDCRGQSRWPHRDRASHQNDSYPTLIRPRRTRNYSGRCPRSIPRPQCDPER